MFKSVIMVVAATIIWSANAWAEPRIDYKGLTLRPGQIVVADGLDAISVLISLATTEFRPFSHSGILVIEDGDPYIYESIGKYAFWQRETPTDVTTGEVTRTEFAKFLKRQRHVEIYEPPDHVDRGAVVAFARKSLIDKVPFDAHFGLDRDRYYCTEFVAYALEAGGHRIDPIPFRDNASLAVLRRWLGIREPSMIPPGALVDQENYVGTITSFPSRTTYHAFSAAKMELHRRFTEDQKLGNVFVVTNNRLDLRPAVQTFVENAMAAFPENEAQFSLARIEARIQALGEAYFGSLQAGRRKAAAATPREDGAQGETRTLTGYPTGS